MAAHLVVFDAMNLIRRIYAVHENQGDAIERVQSQTERMMFTILNQLSATHTVAVFDGDTPGWRHQLWPQYKVSRSPLPEQLSSNLALIQDTWWAAGIDSVLPDNDEADDVIATLAVKSEAHGVAVTIVSTDQGFCQILSDNVHQYDGFNKKFLSRDNYLQKFGINTQCWTQYKALTGESGSDIPGISGFGPKTAKDFVNSQFDESTLAPAKLKSWQEEKENFQLFEQLMTLECHRLLDFKLSALRRKE
ncbi:flap endonuclease Xni [Echinimonas agarilytica]|uniref:Flap endonuclease Xni n=1 Tax=Echinimonas agarilytica TaxID=1215918 RepID=A0AA42B710_9GAMM|nr:flap endonuclease Xni [Echinimonas agarilytica]MCM2679106.1 flap endonuclease Xni [Echinimonas agarilytica]